MGYTQESTPLLCISNIIGSRYGHLNVILIMNVLK